MPIYEYACNACGQRFERKQRFSDEPVADCPECGVPARRVFHAAGIIFKGSGWYITDSRKSNGASDSDHSSSNGATSDSGKTVAASAGKSDSATATKTAADD